MENWAKNRPLRLVLALIVLVAGIALTATSGDSLAVRWVTILLSIYVAAQLAIPRSGA